MHRILLVDWPTRTVPEQFARAGNDVISQEGPTDADYLRYVADGSGDILRQPAGGPPAAVDLVYAFRPLGELPDIIELASSLGARTIWLESKELNSADCEAARQAVEAAGLTFRCIEAEAWRAGE